VKSLGVTTATFKNAKDDSFIKDVEISTSDNESFGTFNPISFYSKPRRERRE
jgi:hypothetical protein